METLRAAAQKRLVDYLSLKVHPVHPDCRVAVCCAAGQMCPGCQQRRKGVSFLRGAGEGVKAGKATVATWRVGLARGRSCLLPWHCLFCVHSLLWGLGEGTEAAEHICGVQLHWYPAFVVLLCYESFSVLPTSGQIGQEKSFCLCAYREKTWKIYLGNVTHSLNYTL